MRTRSMRSASIPSGWPPSVPRLRRSDVSSRIFSTRTWFLSPVSLERRPYLYPLFLFLFAGFLFFPFLGAREFWAPGEPIYAEIIRVMFDRNEWVIPTVNGQLYTDKPIL